MCSKDKICYFTKEFNIGAINVLGNNNITHIEEDGKEITISLQNSLFYRYTTEELINELQNNNEEINIIYGEEGLEAEQTKKETKPIWSIISDGHTLTLKRI